MSSPIFLIKNLKQNGMIPLFQTKIKLVREKILEIIPEDATVGIGGSVTIRQLGIIELLVARGNKVYDHWKPELTKKSVLRLKKEQLDSNFFLTSSNTITLSGKLVNVDNTGNRVTGMIFGPEHVVVVVGRNKIVNSVEDGIKRIKEIAAPLNCQRRGDRTPCKSGIECCSCKSPHRICRVTSIIEKKTKGVRSFTVIIVDKDLGY